MRGEEIFSKARDRATLSQEEAYWLWDEAPLEQLAAVADEVRRQVVPDESVVTWQIDRNVNITNVCISGCKFCNFHCKPHQSERAFITTVEEYRQKIDRMLELGGDQLLLQGGLHPKLGIEFCIGKEIPAQYQLFFLVPNTKWRQVPIPGNKYHADIFSNQIIVFRISSMCFENLQRPGNNIGILPTGGNNADIICGKHFSRPQRRKCGDD